MKMIGKDTGLYAIGYRSSEPGVGYLFDRGSDGWLFTFGAFGYGAGIGWMVGCSVDLAAVWDEGFEAGFDYAGNQSTGSGVFRDPPPNPHVQAFGVG